MLWMPAILHKRAIDERASTTISVSLGSFFPIFISRFHYKNEHLRPSFLPLSSALLSTVIHLSTAASDQSLISSFDSLMTITFLLSVYKL